MFEMNFSAQQNLAQNYFSSVCLDCQSTIDIIKPKFIDFAREISSFTPKELASLDPDKLYVMYQLLDDLAHLEANDDLVELVFKDSDIQKVLPTIRFYYKLFYSIHEIHLVKKILKSKNPWETFQSFPLYPRYKTLIIKQINAMRIVRENKLAFIGCGPFPTSLILMSRLYGIKSIGVDNCSKAARLSKQIINYLGLEKDIKIICGDESTLKDLEWNMVLIAALAEPKVRIFQNLRNILKQREKHIPIIFRTYSGMRKVLYKPVSASDINGFKITKEILPSKRVNNTIVFAELDDH